MRQLAPDLWVIEHPLRRLGMELGTRTSALRLRDGGLWLHSPGPLEDWERRALEALGPVRCIVAPNRLHHLFLASAAACWPQARVFLAPGLAAKLPELPAGQTLGDAAPVAWRDDLEQLHVRGAPLLDEVVFFHPASRTLILADLCFNAPPARGLLEALVQRLNGMRGFGPSRIMRRLVMRDPVQLRESVARIARWPFERIVLAHGAVVERDAARLWQAAWSWLEA